MEISVRRTSSTEADVLVPVPRIHEPPPLFGAGAEVDLPVSVVPFQLHLTPSQRDLRIRVEWANVRIGRSAVLFGVADLSVVRITGVGRPGVVRQVPRMATTPLQGEAAGACRARRWF